MLKRQSGLTLFELLIVILVMVVVMAEIIPRVLQLEHDVRKTAVINIAASLGSISALNYTLTKIDKRQTFTLANCTDVLRGMTNRDDFPPGYRISSVPVEVGQQRTCTLTHPDGVTYAEFTVIGTP